MQSVINVVSKKRKGGIKYTNEWLDAPHTTALHLFTTHKFDHIINLIVVELWQVNKFMLNTE